MSGLRPLLDTISQLEINLVVSLETGIHFFIFIIILFSNFFYFIYLFFLQVKRFYLDGQTKLNNAVYILIDFDF